ncbi:MAG: nucleotide exchange factor GrpE, partial [Hyphomonadaceae bacterium]
MTDDTANTDPAEEATEADPLATAQAEIAKLKDDLLRALAETENTRRRGERAAADARVYAIDRFARDLLPVADALARAQDALPPGESGEAALKLLEGVALTEKTLIEAFGRHGLKPVGAK